MSFLTYPDPASSLFRHDDLSWTTLVLSAHRPEIEPLSPLCTLQRDLLTAVVEAELPISSFRLELLRAWNAACSQRAHEFVGHA